MNTLGNIVSLKSYFSSELILVFGIVALVLLAMRKKSSSSVLAFFVSIFTLLLALYAAVQIHFPKNLSLFEGMISLDPFGQFFKILIMATALVTVVISDKSKDLGSAPRIEFLAFLLALTLGLTMMCVSNDLLMMYLSLEMASVLSYIMAGYLTNNNRSDEAGLKYVLYGGVASGIMIFGMSLLYGLTGSLNLIEIREYFLVNATDRLVLFITFIMILAGLGYKMAVVPFHMWSPDVYEGAPISVTAFLSVASKAAGFAMTLRFFAVAFVVVDKDGKWSSLKALDWQTLVAVLAAFTMTLGNVVAVQQTNIKRFLAYSSVAHAGYMLMGVAVQSRLGVESVIFYFMIYFLMNLGAFLVAIMVVNQFDTETMTDYKGLCRRSLFGFIMALCLGVFLLSLAGIPPFAGFIGKWYVFSAVMQSELYWLAIIGVLNSVVSLYYYVRLVKYMFFDEPTSVAVVQNSYRRYATLMIAFAVLSIAFGIYFEPLAQWAKHSASFLY